MSISQEELSVASLGEKEERTRCYAFEYLLPKLFLRGLIFLYDPGAALASHQNGGMSHSSV